MHELTQRADGRWTMARAEGTQIEWHGLANAIPADSSLDTWADAGGFTFDIHRAPVLYSLGEDAALSTYQQRHVLFRSDSGTPLSVVSEDYQIVQPRQVLDFMYETARANGLRMDTAGVIRNGLKFWALASTDHAFAVGGTDVVKQYVLMASSADNSMATIVKPTSLRVVCSNTFHANINNSEAAIKIKHSRALDETEVRMDLGLLVAGFDAYGEMAEELHRTPVSVNDARRWYAELLTDKHDLSDEDVAEYAARSRLFNGFMRGYEAGPGAEATAWGLFQGVTYTVDWVRGRSNDTRFDSAQFGAGAGLKAAAWKKALEIIDAAKALDNNTEPANL